MRAGPPILERNGQIRNEDVRRILGVNRKNATRLLDGLVTEGWLHRVGGRRGTRYLLAVRH